jgi:serine/threonine-protein kinase
VTTRCIPIGPLFSGEGSRAFLGLRITDDEASPCALVWVPEQAACEPDVVARLRRETLRAAALTHSNILRVFGIAEVDEGLARAVEYADGESLRRVLEVTKRLPCGLAARVAVDAALGVQYAHLSGNEDGTPLVHGDLRPETLLVTYSGVTKVSGYGALTVAPKETDGKRVVGRRRYSAPEQILGGRYAVSPQTDVYLLGVILYEALTGQLPFEGEKDFDAAVVSKQPLLSSEFVPSKLRPVIGKAMAKKACLRFPTVQGFREAVEEATGRLPDRFDLGAFLEAAFADDHARRARQRMLENGIQEWVVRKGLRLASQHVDSNPGPAAPSASSPGTEPRALVEAEAPLLDPEDVHEVPAAGTLPPAEVEAPGPPPLSQALSAAALQEPPTPGQSTAPRAGWRGISPWAVAIPALAAAGAVALWLSKAPLRTNLDTPAAAAPAAAAPDAGDASPAPDGVRPEAWERVAEEGPPRARQVDMARPPRATPTLDVVTSPPLTVSIDGKVVGRAPAKFDLASGSHRVTLGDPSQGIRIVRDVRVKAGANRLSVTVGKGTVTVSGPNGCDVRIDGRVVGKTPLDGPVPVYEGNHRIQVTLGDAHWHETFSVADGEQVTVDMKFQTSERG